MVEVTIPNCYKQAIRSRDASKWHDAMDKEINVMMERKVWDLVDHPDNIKILENRWVYTIKYDENNKIVRYKARLVARGNTQLRGESFDDVFSPVINFTISDGHGYELVSSVRALVPQKFSVEEELMHVKHVEVKIPHVGVMWKFGRGVISSGIVLVT
ncbi:retrovirus-related Pol polyprotein from transposon RE1 [Trichonephila clavipes]|nr:retrovirus-related Pol polyprotein from transposon RE1 [Trichonephila clavipes]